MPNAGDFSWTWIFKDFIRVQKEEGKLVVVCPPSSIKRRIGSFYVVVVQWTSKKSTKKRDARAELLFCSQNQLFSEAVVCRRRRSCLRSVVLNANVQNVHSQVKTRDL